MYTGYGFDFRSGSTWSPHIFQKKFLANIPLELKGNTLEIRLDETGLQKAESRGTQLLDAAEQSIAGEIMKLNM